MAEWTRVCGTGDVPAGEGKCFTVNGRQVALFKTADGAFCAVDDSCNHMGASLSDGALDGDVVICPWHGAQFNVRNGSALGPPARGPATTFKVVVRGKDVMVEG
jgi:nitrite reductase/ring-hydroxylating ferredoxin subunit